MYVGEPRGTNIRGRRLWRRKQKIPWRRKQKIPGTKTIVTQDQTRKLKINNCLRKLCLCPFHNNYSIINITSSYHIISKVLPTLNFWRILEIQLSWIKWNRQKGIDNWDCSSRYLSGNLKNNVMFSLKNKCNPFYSLFIQLVFISILLCTRNCASFVGKR